VTVRLPAQSRRERPRSQSACKGGFSGTCTADSGEFEGIALAGKRSLRLAASLKLMRRA